MNQPTYKVKYNDSSQTYTFTSIGENGVIQKLVRFLEIGENLFNLGFGDFDPVTEQVSDTIVSNNGDMVKVLATIVSILRVFLSENPDVSVIIDGSTPSRIRLYRIIINNYYDDFVKEFIIFGYKDGQYEPLEKDVPYEFFLIQNSYFNLKY